MASRHCRARACAHTLALSGPAASRVASDSAAVAIDAMAWRASTSVHGGTSLAKAKVLSTSAISSRRLFRGIGHQRERVRHSSEEARSRDLLIDKGEQSLAQGQEVSGEVAAVDAGHIVRPQWLQRLGVVPIVEMAAMALKDFMVCVALAVRSTSRPVEMKPKSWAARLASKDSPCWLGTCDGR
jgi:hypothetical protein